MTVMDQYNLRTSPCEIQLIRCTNFITALSCLCDVLAVFIRPCKQVAHLLDIISSLVYHTVSGCMTAQTVYEMEWQEGREAGPVATGATVEPENDGALSSSSSSVYHSLLDKDIEK